MAYEKDSCKATLSLSNYNSADANVIAELKGFTVEDIEKAGKGSGLVFCPSKGTILEFPKTKAEAKLDVDTFETPVDKKIVPVLYGRVFMNGTWQWFPLSAFRRVPVDEYKYVDKDGITQTVNEKLAFFENNDIGRDLAEVRKSDLDVYESLVGNKYEVTELFVGHRPDFDNGKPVDGKYKIVYCFKLGKAKK